MGISFGSKSVKPYVGSKEVTEAYVGNQLVYRAVPPVVYGFLGSENDYAIAEWCQLTDNAAIVKESGIYRIALSRQAYAGHVYGIVTLSEIKGKQLKFTFKQKFQSTRIWIQWVSNGVSQETEITQYFNTADYNLFTWNVPNNTTSISIRVTELNKIQVLGWLDALRYEN